MVPTLRQSGEAEKVARAAKVMERMVNQNTYDDISQGQTESCVHNIILLP